MFGSKIQISNQMESKATFPVSLEEYKLRAHVMDLAVLVNEVQEPWMKKPWGTDLENLHEGQLKQCLSMAC